MSSVFCRFPRAAARATTRATTRVSARAVAVRAVPIPCRPAALALGLLTTGAPAAALRAQASVPRGSILGVAPVVGTAATPAPPTASRSASLAAGRPDTLPTIRVVDTVDARREAPVRPLTGITRGGIYTGKKADALAVPALDANTALNSTRQTLGRVPGLMVWEQDAGGLQAGVAVRGLSPNRSWEFNTRQDGADIASDPFGYPEAYYQPPFEALARVEVVRGAAALQYGPQFGGLLNYVIKRPVAGRPLQVESSQLGGTFGTYATYTALGTHTETRRGGLSAYGFVNLRRGDGWRDHTGFRQGTGHLGLAWESPARGAEHRGRTGQRQRLALAVTRMDYTLEQAGGLTEAQWAADPRVTNRRRDWFSAPWTLPTLTYEGWLSPRTALTVTAFGTMGERNSVGVIAAPTVADTGRTPRRVDRDTYRNVGGELRLVHAFELLGRPAAIAAGARVSRGRTDRDRGRGVDGPTFDLAYAGARTLALTFDTRNSAAFAELSVEALPGVSLAPGVRVERLSMTAGGTFTAASGTTFLPTGTPVAVNDRSRESIPLLGLGASVTRWRQRLGVEFYGNVSEAWRPVLFSERFPNDLVAVDAAMRSASGRSADLGARGTALDGLLTYDVSGFHLTYEDRIGTLNRAALGGDSLRFPNGLRTNVGRSRHYGLEAFGELDVGRLATRLGGGRTPRAGAPHSGAPTTTLFTSVGRTVATYTRGPAAGRQVEYSPDWVVRTGLTHARRDAASPALGDRWRGTLQLSHVSGVYSDASNTVFQANALQGRIPAYTVVDASFSVRVPPRVAAGVRGLRFEANVNNLFDRRYFTRRATGYPGPGLIPAEPRTVLAGLRLDMGRSAR